MWFQTNLIQSFMIFDYNPVLDPWGCIQAQECEGTQWACQLVMCFHFLNVFQSTKHTKRKQVSQFKLAMLVGKLCWAILSIFLVSTASICFFLRNRLRSRNAHHLSGCLYSIVTCWWVGVTSELIYNKFCKKGFFVWGQQPTYDGLGFFRFCGRCWLDLESVQLTWSESANSQGLFSFLPTKSRMFIIDHRSTHFSSICSQTFSNSQKFL